MGLRRAVAVQVVVAVALWTHVADAIAAPELVAVVPADDARRSIVVGTNGEVYDGDGAGAWVRTRLVTTADRITAAGRSHDADGAAGTVVAVGGGVIYRLEPNGWSVVRIANKLHAVMSSGPRAVAAAGSVIVGLGRDLKGDAAKLATAGSTVLALGSGKSVVLATDRGLFRLEGKRVIALKAAPRRVKAFAGDRWGLTDHGAVELRTGRASAWPDDVEIGAAAQAPDDHLIAAGSSAGGGVVVIELGGAKVSRTAVSGVTGRAPVAVSSDARGRVLVVFRDGTVALRDRDAWTISTVQDGPSVSHPGSPPATSP